MRLKVILAVMITVPLLLTCESNISDSEERPAEMMKMKRPNIIFMVGDGMGLAQMSSAFLYKKETPNFSRFPIVGLIKTTSGSHKITDSAAGATAFSCGKKTYNGAIGVDMDTTSAKTIMEELSEKGWNTGLVSTSSVTHATPASFYAHVPSRMHQEEIARQLVYSDVDFIAGGGFNWFLNRTDSINYADSLLKNGFVLDTNSMKSKQVETTGKPVYLMAPDGLIAKHLGRDEFLLEATNMALNYLDDSDEPFFLLIEGSQIDWGGHANNGDYIIQEVLDFDQAVGAALDFAAADSNTLVVVTADHETGGFTMASETKLGPYRTMYSDYNSVVPQFSTGGHSYSMVPVLAYGNKAELFSGIYDNTKIHSLFQEISK
jgi:alkaline phosphatase